MINRWWVLLLSVSCIAAAEDTWTGVERIVVVGDLHADFDQTVAILRSANLIGPDLNWTGGKAHLVQVGDAIDRGPEPKKVLDLLMKLEPDAKSAGGYVHALIGNHEALNINGDLRYVNPAAYREFAAAGSSGSETQHPAGYEEYKKQFGPNGRYGKWIRRHNVIVKINGNAILHGGISPLYASVPIHSINERIREELADPAAHPKAMARDPQGPLWYRALANGDEKALAGELDSTLQALGASRMIIGHTFADGAVTPRFGGKVLMVDIGLAHLYDEFSRLACLVIERDTAYALHRGKRVDLPSDNGPDLLRYLKEAARLDPQPSSLLLRIQKLQAALEPARTAQ